MGGKGMVAVMQTRASKEPTVEQADLVAELGEDRITWLRLRHRRCLFLELHLLSMISGSLLLALLLEALHNFAVLPADFVRDAAQHAEATSRLQARHPESIGHPHALLDGEIIRNALEALEALHGALAAVCLVGNHPTDHAVENTCRRAEVVGAMGRVCVCPLAQFVKELQLVPVERTRYVDVLAPDAHNLLATEELLGNDARQPTHQVVFAVNDDELLEHPCLPAAPC